MLMEAAPRARITELIVTGSFPNCQQISRISIPTGKVDNREPCATGGPSRDLLGIAGLALLAGLAMVVAGVRQRTTELDR